MRCSSAGPGRPDRFRLDQHARPVPATAAHGVELQPGGEDQRGPPLPSVARSTAQLPLTQADKIVLIWLAGMEVRRPEEKVAASFTSEAGEDPLGSVS